MLITKTRDENKLTVEVSGRIDSMTAPEFEEFLKENLDGVTELTINMASLDYISSAGLRVLLLAQKKMNTQGTMEVLNVNETVGEILDVTGFSDILTIR
ncbi:MAG: STAS domain-containing protein [Clostridia bacterium]|nr:STAS domain-containing protein [Clostridia bacterium]